MKVGGSGGTAGREYCTGVDMLGHKGEDMR